MDNNGKIYIAGHRSMVDSAILGICSPTCTHRELDLTNQVAGD